MKLAIKRMQARHSDGKLILFGLGALLMGFLCGRYMVNGIAEGALTFKSKSGQTTTILIANEPGLFWFVTAILTILTTLLTYSGVIGLIAALSTRQSEG